MVSMLKVGAGLEVRRAACQLGRCVGSRYSLPNAGSSRISDLALRQFSLLPRTILVQKPSFLGPFSPFAMHRPAIKEKIEAFSDQNMLREALDFVVDKAYPLSAKDRNVFYHYVCVLLWQRLNREPSIEGVLLSTLKTHSQEAVSPTDTRVLIERKSAKHELYDGLRKRFPSLEESPVRLSAVIHDLE